LRQFLQKHEIQREPSDLNQVVREAGKLIESTLHKHEVRCDYQLADDLPSVFLDRIQIMQVLLNLLLNAAEALADIPADRRQITVQTGRRDDGSVFCAVRDNGPGLPAGLPHDIFDAFVTTKPEGLGLGLSISRSILQAHGGTIRASNHPDGGAEFTFTFAASSAGV
jgi:C4-dicarboxylate-specific signal transduction histidine kinase